MTRRQSLASHRQISTKAGAYGEDDHGRTELDWVYVFDVDEQPPGSGQPTPVTITAVIGTDAASLSRMALDVAPARAADLGGTQDAMATAVRRRLARYAPELM